MGGRGAAEQISTISQLPATRAVVVRRTLGGAVRIFLRSLLLMLLLLLALLLLLSLMFLLLLLLLLPLLVVVAVVVVVVVVVAAAAAAVVVVLRPVAESALAGFREIEREDRSCR